MKTETPRWKWPLTSPTAPLEVRQGAEVAGRLVDWRLQVVDGHLVFTGRWAPGRLPDPTGAALSIPLRSGVLACRVTAFDAGEIRLQAPI